jgi:hypothetical protein
MLLAVLSTALQLALVSLPRVTQGIGGLEGFTELWTCNRPVHCNRPTQPIMRNQIGIPVSGVSVQALKRQ